ncbi:hypothetical protein [Cellulomonas sp. P24]|uniref:hypothetical protein n=1 Tax=Cellulomonas sp. P24 TaxID=2885206 RepID=UPI00216AD1C0|nr:hypothetical protein [Cellulomonas sp. P24]MCR6492525.1 hypothetical protein [Cellulomonas sp. P24]
MKTLLSKRPAQYLAIAVAFIAAVAAIAAGLEHLSPAWPAAIQAVGSIALLLVTYRYVILTERLALQQERPITAIRLQIRETAARKLGQAIVRDSYMFSSMAAATREAVERTPPDWRNAFDVDDVKQIRALAEEIESLTLELPPQLMAQAQETYVAVFKACLYNISAANVVAEEVVLAKTEGRDVDPKRLETEWTVSKRPRLHGKPEWAEVLAGEALLGADLLCDELITAVRAYLSE